MHRRLAVLGLLVMACGGQFEYPGSSPATPQAEECDLYTFLTGFMHTVPMNRMEINCHRDISQVLWEDQEFTVYANKDTTVYYWANARAVRVEGLAPQCIKSKLAEPVPRPPMMESQCKRKPTVF